MPNSGEVAGVIGPVGARLGLKYAHEIFVDADLVCIFCERVFSSRDPVASYQNVGPRSSTQHLLPIIHIVDFSEDTDLLDSHNSAGDEFDSEVERTLPTQCERANTE